MNLLYNSSRNSPESAGIRVGAMREADHVAFSVADDGRGLSPELIPYLFRKFARFEGDDPEHGAGGSGLGLAICRGIVEAHGGRIRAESAGMGLGARFHVHSSGGRWARGNPPDRVSVDTLPCPRREPDPHSRRG